MIPRILHYCWFGGEKSALVKECMASWTKAFPQDVWTIMEWNETNCDLNRNEFVKSAAKLKNWAFVSDWVRLKVLYEYGGVYLDTDVEVYKSFEDLLSLNGFLGYRGDSTAATAILGFEPHNPFVAALIGLYEGAVWVDEKAFLIEIELPNGEKHVCGANNDVFTQLLSFRYRDLRLDGKLSRTDDFVLFPKEEFEIGRIIGRGHCVHRCSGSWFPYSSKQESKKAVLRIAKRIPIIHGDALLRRISHIDFLVKAKGAISGAPERSCRGDAAPCQSGRKRKRCG